MNFVLDGEESHVRVTRGRLAARDGLNADARITVRGTVHDLYLLATAPGPPTSSTRSFEVDGDRESAERLLDHLMAGIHRAAEEAADMTQKESPKTLGKDSP